MLFNTAQYLFFLPFVVLIYYILPVKIRHIWLLGVSYYFYMQWNALYVLLLVFSTITTYGCGLIIGRPQKSTKNHISHLNLKKICLISCILVNLSILFFYKYFLFSLSCLNQLLVFSRLPPVSWEINIVLPVGISFYMLQSLGYLIDIYRNDITPEKIY